MSEDVTLKQLTAMFKGIWQTGKREWTFEFRIEGKRKVGKTNDGRYYERIRISDFTSKREPVDGLTERQALKYLIDLVR